jgi:fibronectin type 3 domain-containing protein
MMSGAVMAALPQARTSGGTNAIFAAASNAPSNLVATAAIQQNKAVVNLTWTNNAPTAQGYLVFRSTTNTTFDLVTRINGISNTAYTDVGVSGNTTYYYMVLATMASGNSAAPKTVSVKTPVVASASPLVATPMNVAAQMMSMADGSLAVAVFWMDGNRVTAGNTYRILRGVDGGACTQIAVTKDRMYTDTTTTVDTKYQYQVITVTPSGAQSAPGSATLTTVPGTPTNVTATVANNRVSLSWSETDTKATGYTILTSTDGNNFTQIGQVSGYNTRAWTSDVMADGTVAFYKVCATGPGGKSANSGAVNVRVTGNVKGVSITQRFSSELVVNATGDSDSIVVKQSGGQLLITANGNTQTRPLPAGGLFIYLRGGQDTVQLDASVQARVTVESIDGAVSTISSGAANVQAWIDAADVYSGTGSVHAVGSFAGGVPTTAGASVPNPTDFASTISLNYSLFGAGPVAGDAIQGNCGDCYFISALSSVANNDAAALYNSVVDMGDGTYTVRMMVGGTPTYVRVSNQFVVPQPGYAMPFFARYGPNKTIWALVLEKAYAYTRRGTNTYMSLNGGYEGEVYDTLGVTWQNFGLSNQSDAGLFATLSNDLATGKPVTFATTLKPPDLVPAHGYTLVGVTKVNGVNLYQVRNPWGGSGGKLENSSGIASLTFAQLVANMAGGTVANV